MARLVATAFEREGFNVWWDAALHSGETFDEVIEKELRAAKAVVVLWSPRSVASRWVRAEATLADRNRTLAPAIIEPCERPIIFELTHTVDLSTWSGDPAEAVWQGYVKDIHRLVQDDIPGKARQARAEAKKQAEAPLRRRPAPAPAGNPAGQLDGANMESLISAISTLQQQLRQQGTAPPPQAEPVARRMPPPPLEEEDDSEATQFFTPTDEFGMLQGDEFHCLELSIGDELQERHIVGPLGLKIGRTKPADVILADSKVSRSHCLVELNDDTLFVTDLGSTNGTYIDGQRVTGAAILPVGSVLRVGHFTLKHEVRSRAEI